ncbi:MAG: class I SAM-dependent methyltransferase [Pseudomonadales bacterium]|jgi:SAM-dependent methyltransferase|tara:strand:+ start:267 stop:1001 length:735 start_codon:yes stop_codon:yes gene_type:complete
MNDAADFYTGLIAELYEPLASGITGSRRFIDFVKTHGEPALEICCGTGLPILDLIEAGLDVEGLDASEDMLKICNANSRKRNLEVTLHHSKMQDFAVPRKYRSVYVANGSITLLSSDADLHSTLVRIRACLAPTGTVLIDLDVPNVADLRKYVGRFKTTEIDGYQLRVGMTHLEWNEISQQIVAELRYERIDPKGEVESVDRSWARTIWNVDQFSEHLINAGFNLRSVDESHGELIQVFASVAT